MNKTISSILSTFLLLVVFVGNIFIGSITNKQNSQIVETISQAEQTIKLPVIMYHHILKDENRKCDYVITPSQFENDLRYIKNNGYTPISIAELLNYIDNNAPLPEKPILITFDDGYESFYTYAYPLLQEYKCKSVLSIIGKYTDLYSANTTKNISYSHITWDELKEVSESGFVEVANHSYDLHYNENGKRQGIKQLKNESNEEYIKILEENIKTLNNQITKKLDIVNYTFAYPFGFYSNTTKDILKDFGFRVVFNCEEKLNYINKDEYKDNIIELNRFNRSGCYTTQEFFNKIEKKKS